MTVAASSTGSGRLAPTTLGGLLSLVLWRFCCRPRRCSRTRFHATRPSPRRALWSTARCSLRLLAQLAVAAEQRAGFVRLGTAGPLGRPQTALQSGSVRRRITSETAGALEPRSHRVCIVGAAPVSPVRPRPIVIRAFRRASKPASSAPWRRGIRRAASSCGSPPDRRRQFPSCPLSTGTEKCTTIRKRIVHHWTWCSGSGGGP
jgi:hypothetical protein